MRYLPILAIIFLAILVVAPLDAGDGCGAFFGAHNYQQRVVVPKQHIKQRVVVRKQAVVEHHPVHTPHIQKFNGYDGHVYYQVAPYVTQSAYDRVRETKLAVEVAKAVIDGLIKGGAVPSQQPAVQQPGTLGLRQNSVLSAKCASCHTRGGQGEAAGLLDGTTPVSDTLFRKAVEQIVSGDMPPTGELEGADKGRVMDELLGLIER